MYLIYTMISLVIISAVFFECVWSSPQHSYSAYNNLFRRGSAQPVFAAHPTQLPYSQNQQRRQYQQQQPHPAFKATAGGYNPPIAQAQSAAPPLQGQTLTPKDVVPILAYSNDLQHDGTYSYNYETGDGMSRQESGVMTNPGTPEEAQSVTGSYAYTAPDGTLIQVTYVADANGFRAEGAHLPTPPPIPEPILRSLEYIAAKQREAPQQDYNQPSQPAAYQQRSRHRQI